MVSFKVFEVILSEARDLFSILYLYPILFFSLLTPFFCSCFFPLAFHSSDTCTTVDDRCLQFGDIGATADTRSMTIFPGQTSKLTLFAEH